MKNTQILDTLKRRTQQPIENIELLSEYIDRSLADGAQMTFFNWECPPRFLDADPTGRSFVNYDVDLGKVMSGRKIDRFTELPRVLLRRREEVDALTFLKNCGLNVKFVKLIADTNAFYLTPRSVSVLGEQRIRETFEAFRANIQSALFSYPDGSEAKLFTTVMRRWRNLYENIFNASLRSLLADPSKLVSENIWKEQLARTAEHVGIIDPVENELFAARTIASYAAEGVVLDRLSRTPAFKNCVWLNNHEVDRRTVEITNCMRRKLGIGDLPMLFWG